MTEALEAELAEAKTPGPATEEFLKVASRYFAQENIPLLEGMEPPSVPEHLASLPHEGFESDEQRMQVIYQIDAIGLPVDNYRSLARKPNDVRKGTEDYLGSWGVSGEHKGQFSIYERLDVERPEERLGVMVHEGAHAASPLRPENAALYGGEAGRREAEKLALNIASQALLTKIYLNPYHKRLGKQYFAGEITQGLFAEETQAIASQLALTNRAKLAQVEAAQHQKLSNLQKANQAPAGYQPVNLLSKLGEDGLVVPDGIDKQMITLLRDVDNYEQLIARTGELKKLFYPEETWQVADERFKRQTDEIMHAAIAAYAAFAAEMERQARAAVAKVMKDSKEDGEKDDEEKPGEVTNYYLAA